jgi:TolB-like protein
LIKTSRQRGFRFIGPVEVLRQPKDADLALPDKPSIAVLPFKNLSDDVEQEYFADGITEDVTTALARFNSLFVIDRNSSFSYKDTSPDIRTVARELGVRYVVEGSVRKADRRVRITAQLIDAASGNHLWADHFDGALGDVFDLQDQITEQIVASVTPEIDAHELERVRRKPPESLGAWETYQRCMLHAYRNSRTHHTEYLRLLKEATELDPGFAAAHAVLAWQLFLSVQFGYAEDRDGTIASARAIAEKAVSLDQNEPWAHVALGRAYTVSGETEMAIIELRTAITLNPNFVWGHYELGFAYQASAGQPEQALPHFEAALRLGPRNPARFGPLMMKGSALRFLGRHDEAVECCRQACQFPDTSYFPYLHLAAALAEAGKKSEAKAAADRAMEIQPRLSISFYRENIVGLHERTAKSMIGSMRKAGFPEE